MRKCCVLGTLILCLLNVPVFAQEKPTGTVHTYYVAADEVDWNYTPSGIDKMMGMDFMGYAKVFTERGPHRIGTTYRKALYREYTDETFTKLKPRAPECKHLDMV